MRLLIEENPILAHKAVRSAYDAGRISEARYREIVREIARAQERRDWLADRRMSTLKATVLDHVQK